MGVNWDKYISEINKDSSAEELYSSLTDLSTEIGNTDKEKFFCRSSRRNELIRILRKLTRGVALDKMSLVRFVMRKISSLPRFRLSSVPYSFISAVSNKLSNKDIFPNSEKIQEDIRKKNNKIDEDIVNRRNRRIKDFIEKSNTPFETILNDFEEQKSKFRESFSLDDEKQILDSHVKKMNDACLSLNTAIREQKIRLDIPEDKACEFVKLRACDSLNKMFCSYIEWIIALLGKKGLMSDYETVMKSVDDKIIISTDANKYFNDVLKDSERFKSRYSYKHEYWKKQLEQVKPKIIKNEISDFKTSFSEHLKKNMVYGAYEKLLEFKKNLKSWEVEIDNNLKSLFEVLTKNFKTALENLLLTNYIGGKKQETYELLEKFKKIIPKNSKHFLMLKGHNNFYKALDDLFDENQTTLSYEKAVGVIKAIQELLWLSPQLATKTKAYLSKKVIDRIGQLLKQLKQENYIGLYEFCVVCRFIELKFEFNDEYCKVLNSLASHLQQKETMWIYWQVLQVKDNSDLKSLIEQSNLLSKPDIDLLKILHNSDEAKNDEILSNALNKWLIDNSSKKDDLTKKVADAMDLIKKEMDDKVKALADNLNYYDTLSTIKLASVRDLIKCTGLLIPLPKKIENLDELVAAMRTLESNLKDQKKWLNKLEKEKEKKGKRPTKHECNINILQYLLYYLECVLRNSKFKHDDEFKFWNIGDNKKPLVTIDDLSQGSLGDCWFISSLVKLVLNEESLDFFPYAKAEIAEDGMVKSESVTVRLYKVHLKESGNIICVTTPEPEKPIYMKIKKDTVLTMRRAKFGNISPVLWPNFLEQAMTAAKHQEDMVTGSSTAVQDLIEMWHKKTKGIQALRGGFTDGIASCMLTGKEQKILESNYTDKTDLHLGYTTDEMKIFRYIQKKLNNKQYLNVGIASKKTTLLDKYSKDLDDVTTFALQQQKTQKDIRDRILKIEKGTNYMFELPSNHAYTVVGTKIDTEGYYVVLKNPWNNPTRKGGDNIEVPLKMFCKWCKRNIG